MDRLTRAVVVALGCGVTALFGSVHAQQLAQAAIESAVITKGTTSSARGPQASRSGAAKTASRSSTTASLPASEYFGPTEIGPAMNITIGKSVLIRLPSAIERISVGSPGVADVTLISPRELYLLGKTFGATNVIMWRKGAATTIIDVNVNMDAGALESRLAELLPGENDIRVHTAADAVVLSGTVSSALMADYAVSIAEAFARSYSRGFTLPITAGDTSAPPDQRISVRADQQRGAGGSAERNLPRVINMMSIAQPQQVMLEVKVAEISKKLLDKLGVGIDAATIQGSWRYSILSNFLSGSSGVLGMLSRTGNQIQIDAESTDGLIRVLAEPNIVSISGQEASFLAGGKIFLPVARTTGTLGLATVTLEEKDFGVGLKFTPTVLDGGRINLKVAPEVSEPTQTGTPFSTINGQTSVLPSFTTRRAQTTVQLMDGQSFVIAGLIKNNVAESVKRFPVLGDVPILGALFRSSEFQTDRSELMFLVTARLVKPLHGQQALPTDNFVPPNRAEFFLNGQLEGSGHPAVPPTELQRRQMEQQGATGSQGAMQPASVEGSTSSTTAPAQGGYQLK